MVSRFALTPFAAVMLSMMFALNDAQLALVMTAAGSVPVEKRGVFLECVAAREEAAECRTHKRATQLLPRRIFG